MEIPAHTLKWHIRRCRPGLRVDCRRALWLTMSELSWVVMTDEPRVRAGSWTHMARGKKRHPRDASAAIRRVLNHTAVFAVTRRRQFMDALTLTPLNGVFACNMM